jgi:hypothetical protein
MVFRVHKLLAYEPIFSFRNVIFGTPVLKKMKIPPAPVKVDDNDLSAVTTDANDNSYHHLSTIHRCPASDRIYRENSSVRQQLPTVVTAAPSSVSAFQSVRVNSANPTGELRRNPFLILNK